ncbi:MAG: hypothetical protein ACUZ8A_08190 [Candidatus Bathyanammoxibius sp.]
MLSHVIPDCRLAAPVAFIVDESAVDAATGVMLLGGTELVTGRPLVYDGNVWAEYRSLPGMRQMVAGRTGIPGSHRPDRVVVVVTLPRHLAYTFAFDQEGPANLFFLVHVKHLFPPVSEVSSSIPDYPDPVDGFSTVTLPSGVGAFYPGIYNRPRYFRIVMSSLLKDGCVSCQY